MNGAFFQCDSLGFETFNRYDVILKGDTRILLFKQQVVESKYLLPTGGIRLSRLANSYFIAELVCTKRQSERSRLRLSCELSDRDYTNHQRDRFRTRRSMSGHDILERG